LLRRSKFEVIDSVVSIWEIIKLPNNILLAANYKDSKLELFDQNFKHLNTIEQINGEAFRPIGIDINKKDDIYISDHFNDRILMVDLDFNLIKAVGSRGSGQNQFNKPCGICFHYNKLFVCDGKNYRIVIFTQDLEFINAVKLDYMPWLVKASNSTLCIETDSPGVLYFYNLTDFSLKHKYEYGVCRISEVDSSFYAFHHSTQTVFCFDENGTFKNEINFKGFERYVGNYYDGFIFKLNNENIVMSFHNKRKLIKFSK
jgi:hypothetical protein